MPTTRAALLLSALALAGCATLTPDQFNAQKASLSDTRVCRVWLNSGGGLMVDAHAEAMRRNLSREQCDSFIRRENIAGAIAAVAIIGLAVAASKSGGGGGAGGGYAGATNDYDWDWDMFYNEQRLLVWACRGVQTGQFADQYRCNFKAKTDARWPSLQALR